MPAQPAILDQLAVVFQEASASLLEQMAESVPRVHRAGIVNEAYAYCASRRYAIPAKDLCSIPLTPDPPAIRGEAKEYLLKAIRRCPMSGFAHLKAETHALHQKGYDGVRPSDPEAWNHIWNAVRYHEHRLIWDCSPVVDLACWAGHQALVGPELS